jgi:sarcosine oxidase subunit gamma
MADMLERRPPSVTRTGWLTVLPAAARYSLRGGPDAVAAASAAFGVALPTTACRAAANDGRAALWLGPDEHLLIAPDAEGPAVASALATALAGVAHSLVDVSHRQVALELSGPHAATLLASGCPLDLDLSEFPVGMCTRTVFAKAEVLLCRTADDTFRLEVWRSFVDYVVGVLGEAARELPA